MKLCYGLSDESFDLPSGLLRAGIAADRRIVFCLVASIARGVELTVREGTTDVDGQPCHVVVIRYSEDGGEALHQGPVKALQ